MCLIFPRPTDKHKCDFHSVRPVSGEKSKNKSRPLLGAFRPDPYTSTDVIHSVVEDEEEVSGRFPKVLVYDGYDKAEKPGTE